MGDFDKCCNLHDICYSGCNDPKLDCDRALSECLNSACKNWEHDENWEKEHKFCKCYKSYLKLIKLNKNFK